MSDERDKNYGPKMAKLTPLQRAWVEALLTTGGNQTKAAHLAGYGAKAATQDARDNACAQAGFANSRNPAIREAIHEEAGNRLMAGAVLGASVLEEIARDPLHKDRLKAAVRLLDHSGFQIIAKQEIAVTHEEISPEAQEAKIIDLANRLGLDPKKLLGQAAAGKPLMITEAEFVEVRDTTPTAKGLEDFL